MENQANTKRTQHVPSTELLRHSSPLQLSESDDTLSISATLPSYLYRHSSRTEEEILADVDTFNFHQIAVKILVTNSATGAVIGRSGKTIAGIQTRTNTRIKLSQSGEYYPGTNVASRVCLIQGTLADTKVAVELIFLKLYETQSVGSGESHYHLKLPASFSVRLLVPTSFCGMLIGRSGSNIKQLKEESGVTLIQLSPKGNEDDVLSPDGISVSASTSERIMTIAGPNLKSCVQCVQLILTDMASNPELSRYVNMTTRYSKVMCQVQAPPPRHEPSCLGFHLQYPVCYNTNSGAIERFYPLLHGLCIETSPTRQLHIPVETHSISHSAPGISALPGPTLPDGLIPSGLIAPVNELTDFFQEQSLGLFSRPRSPQGISHDITCDIGIPENVVGSILGQGGNILDELQTQSKTRIRLSRRGEFFPGTNQRIVTITGPSSESLASAQYLIRKRISAIIPHSK